MSRILDTPDPLKLEPISGLKLATWLRHPPPPEDLQNPPKTPRRGSDAKEKREFRKNRLPFLETPLMEQNGQEEQLREARQRYKSRALSLLGQASQQEEATSKPRKRHRTSAYEWLLLCDATLRSCSGADGFAHYQVLPDDTRPALEWPLLKVALDQDSDGFSAAHFVLAEDCCIEICPDMAHGANIDLKGLAKDLGLWQHEIMMSVAYNFNQAPWGSGIRHLQLRESFLARPPRDGESSRGAPGGVRGSEAECRPLGRPLQALIPWTPEGLSAGLW